MKVGVIEEVLQHLLAKQISGGLPTVVAPRTKETRFDESLDMELLAKPQRYLLTLTRGQTTLSEHLFLPWLFDADVETNVPQIVLVVSR